MEAVVPDVDGTWYGYYHNELPRMPCGDAERTVPRIGAARSRESRSDLGGPRVAARGAFDQSLIATPRTSTSSAAWANISVMLDAEERDLYIFFSEYLRMAQQQGVGIARSPGPIGTRRWGS
jgi:hypothetical protein